MGIGGFLNAADFFVVAVIVLFAAMGMKRGLVKSAIGLLSLAASVVIAYLLKPVIYDLLSLSPFNDVVSKAVGERLSGAFGDVSYLPRAMQGAAESGINTVTTDMTASITGAVLNITSFTLVLVIARLIIFVAAFMLKAAVKLPIIGFVDKAAGMFAGIFKAIVLLYIIFALMGATLSMKDGDKLAEAINTSKFAKTMYLNNPVCRIMSNTEAD